MLGKLVGNRGRFSRGIAVCALIFATGASAAPLKKTLRVGVLFWSMSIPGQVAMRKGLEQEAAFINRDADKNRQARVELIPYVAGDGSAGIEHQIAQMFDAVKRKPDIIIVQPTDNAALAAPLRAANLADIPVVAYDQYISGGKLAAFVTSDNYQAGYLDGEYLAAHFPDDQKIKLILVEYPHVSSTVERANGLLDALRDYRQPFRILKSYEAVEPHSGALAGAQILRDFPAKGSVDAIFSVNDGGGLNVVKALADAGRTEIVVASIDGDPESIANIRAKRLTHIDTAQFCGPLGAEAMKIAYAIVNGKKVAPHQLVPVFPITAETLQRYPGWDGPIPARFAKPWQAHTADWDGAVKAVD